MSFEPPLRASSPAKPAGCLCLCEFVKVPPAVELHCPAVAVKEGMVLALPFLGHLLLLRFWGKLEDHSFVQQAADRRGGRRQLLGGPAAAKSYF